MKVYSVYGAFGATVHEMTAQEADEMAVRLKAGDELTLDGIYVVGSSSYRLRAESENPIAVKELPSDFDTSELIRASERRKAEYLLKENQRWMTHAPSR